MKKKWKVLSVVILVLAMVPLLLLGTLSVRLITSGQSFTDFFVSSITDRLYPLEISYGSIDSHLLRRIGITDLRVSLGKEEILNAREVRLSSGLLDALSIYLFNSHKDITLTLDSPSVHISDELLGTIRSNQNRSGQRRVSEKDRFSNVGLSLEISDAAFVFETNGLSLVSKGLDAKLDYSFSEGVTNIRATTGYISVPEYDASLDDIKILMGHDKELCVWATYLRTKDILIAKDVSLTGDVSRYPEIRLDAMVSRADGSYSGYEFNSRDIRAEGNLNISNLDGAFSLNVSTVSVGGEILNVLSENTTGDLNLRNGLVSHAAIRATDTELDVMSHQVGLGSSEISYSPQGQSFLSIKGITHRYFTGPGELVLFYDSQRRISGNLSISDEAKGYFSYQPEEGDVELRLDLNDLRPLNHETVLDEYVPFIKNIFDSDTRFEGHLHTVFNTDLRNPDAFISFSFSGSDVNVGGNSVSLGVALDASVADSMIDVEDFDISVLGHHLNYKGQIGLDDRIPTGEIKILDDSGRTLYTGLDIIYDQDSRFYSFSALESVGGESLITGSLDLARSGIYAGKATVHTLLKDYPIDLVLDYTESRVSVFGSGIDLIGSLDDHNRVIIEGSVDDLSFSISENFSVDISTEVNGLFDISRSGWNLSFDGFSVRVPDLLSIGFDINVGSQKAVISDIRITQGNKQYFFDGQATFYGLDYSDLDNTELLNVVVDLFRQNSEHYINISSDGDGIWVSAYFDFLGGFRFNLIGSITDEIFAELSIGDNIFKASYNNGIVTVRTDLENSAGASIRNLLLTFDVGKRSISAVFDLNKVLENWEGDVVQKANVSITGKLDDFSVREFRLSSVRAKVDFDVSIRDGMLGDFAFDDIDFTLSITESGLFIEGDDINGNYEFRTGNCMLSIRNNDKLCFDLEGRIRRDSVDLGISNILFDAMLLNQFLNFPVVRIEQSVLTGDILVQGKLPDPHIYGMIYSDNLALSVFYTPDQVISVKSPVFSIVDNSLTLARTAFVGYGKVDGRRYEGKISLDLEIRDLSVDTLDVVLEIPDKPIDFWLPLLSSDTDLMMRGDVTGVIDLRIRNKQFGVYGDIKAENYYFCTTIPQLPAFIYEEAAPAAVGITVEVGKNCKFYYPDLDNSFLSGTAYEGAKVSFFTDENLHVGSEGTIRIKSGRLYYINNEFSITDGSIGFSTDENHSVRLTFDLSASIREYDTTGKPVDISIRLPNVTLSQLENFSPELNSSSGLNENEVLRLLGSSAAVGRNSSGLIALVDLASRASDTLDVLGIRETFSRNNTLTNSIKDAIGLDIFSLRSRLVENILMDYLPGKRSDETSLLARYLDGTVIYLGKSLNEETFLRGTAMLNAVDISAVNSSVGHYITDDLNLNLQLSLDFNAPFGTFSLFTVPQELNAYSFIDNMGISLNFRLQP